MKSGIFTPCDPFLGQPFVDPNGFIDPFVDHNMLLDYASFSKDDPANDWVNYSDSQLEEIIFNNNLDVVNEFKFDDDNLSWNTDLKNDCSYDPIGIQESFNQDGTLFALTDVSPESSPEPQQVANYEEVDIDMSKADSASSVDYESEQSDNESVQSFVTQSSVASIKRKRSGFNTSTPRKKKRAKRVLDDRVKTQNKIAALKYRVKKREEKDSMERDMQKEEEKNKMLKTQVEELSVQVNIIKELLGKYLDSKQLNKLSML